MTEDEAYKILAVQNLGGFGWSITIEDMVDIHTADTVINRILAWWNGLDQNTPATSSLTRTSHSVSGTRAG